MQNTTPATMQELNQAEIEQIAGGNSDAWWARNRPMAAKIGLSRSELMGAM